MAVSGRSDDAWIPACLPGAGSPSRWPWLQALARQPALSLEPWLRAVESGAVEPQSDLLAVLAPLLDGAAAARLLAFWIREAERGEAPAGLLELVGRIRDPLCAALLRRQLGSKQPLPIDIALLPLLGHQRDPVDFPLLRCRAVEPGPSARRAAALEGVARGLSAWPQPALVDALERLAVDLDPGLAAQAVDLLARLPLGGAALERLTHGALEPGVRRRLERRRQGWGAAADQASS
jgi:hypothetical protein